MPARDAGSGQTKEPGAPLDQRFDNSSQTSDSLGALDDRLRHTLSGVAHIERQPGALRLTAGPTTARAYCNAQLDDYHHLRWRPPLLLRVRSRASRAAWPSAVFPSEEADYLRGTAGFGFWNASPTLVGAGPPRPPEAVWFFAASPPSDMALTPGVPGYGWKAQVIHTQRPSALAAILPMAATALWANISGDDRPAARWLNRLTGACETPLDPHMADLRDWHDFEIEWREDAARFRVDGQEVLYAPEPPHGPLGFVTWIDNQYAIATPRGRLRFGTLATKEQRLELASLSIQPF